MATLLVIEDSSKVGMGGGQEMTLALLREFRGSHGLHLFDVAGDSRFLARVRGLGIRTHRLRGHGRVVHDERASFSHGWLELLLLPIFLPVNVAQVATVLRRAATANGDIPILLSATHKAFLVAWLCSFLVRVRLVHYEMTVADHRLAWRLFFLLLRRAEVVLALSPTVAETLPVPAVVLPGVAEGPAGTPVPRQLLDGREAVVAVFATLQRLKGIDVFLRSLALMRHRDRVSFRIYGEGPRRDELGRLAGDDPRIRFMGQVDFAEAAGEIDIVVLPSVAPEAFGLNLVKAAARGMPVVATGIGAHAELVRDGVTGLLVPPNDPAALAAAIDRLLEDPAGYARMSAAACAWAREYDTAHFRERLAGVMARLT